LFHIEPAGGVIERGRRAGQWAKCALCKAGAVSEAGEAGEEGDEDKENSYVSSKTVSLSCMYYDA
jgi:hypothetical protein